MSDTSWSRDPVLGLVQAFHLDPSVGGPPLASPDGHLWWDGEQWRPRHEEGAPAA
ncbi:hypothetical protein BH11ACT8_BH11ACT8_21110 [soil metagenome]